MGPTFSMQNKLNITPTNAVFFCKLSGRFNYQIVFSDFYYLVFSKFGQKTRTSPKPVSLVDLSALLNRVSNIVFRSSKKKMIGSYASWIVALMTNIKTGRYWTVDEFPRKSMGPFVFKLTIPMLTAGEPFPTFTNVFHMPTSRSIFINFFPEYIHRGHMSNTYDAQ